MTGSTEGDTNSVFVTCTFKTQNNQLFVQFIITFSFLRRHWIPPGDISEDHRIEPQVWAASEFLRLSIFRQGVPCVNSAYQLQAFGKLQLLPPRHHSGTVVYKVAICSLCLQNLSHNSMLSMCVFAGPLHCLSALLLSADILPTLLADLLPELHVSFSFCLSSRVAVCLLLLWGRKEGKVCGNLCKTFFLKCLTEEPIGMQSQSLRYQKEHFRK